MDKKQFGRHGIGAAVDLGSTTIAVCCMDLETGEEVASFSFSNPQRIYGADVITRIRHCIDDVHKLAVMGQMTRDSLWEQLRVQLGKDCSLVERIVYSGNTTMIHILRGMSVEGLAAAPFTPVSLEYAECMEEKPSSVYEKNSAGDGCAIPKKEKRFYTALYPPGFSAFVGADILTGGETLSMGRTDSYDLLVDLGTNGEMLLLKNDRGYATSTACGTVFDHAVTGAEYGSECIKAIANCVRRRLIDNLGTMKEPFFTKGIEIDRGLVIRQSHVRNFQMAKGAVCAGIYCLMKKAGITANQIGSVYISGGLGFYMNIRDAVVVKMLPRELTGKMIVSGNTSLNGAKQLLIADGEEKERLLSDYEAIRRRTECIDLAEMEAFQDIYIQSLNF